MSVSVNANGEIEIFNEWNGCPDCGDDLYDSGCEAPGCNGWGCQCRWGCDAAFAPDEDSKCAQAIADESEEDREARVTAERAAFGLPPIIHANTKD